MKQNIIDIRDSFAIAAIFSLLTTIIVHYFGYTIGYLEGFAVLTGYAATFLCVRESRLNYVWGVICVILSSIMFYQQNLLGSMALNIYLIPTLIYGWFIWGKSKDTKPVGFVKTPNHWALYLLAAGLIYFGAIGILNYFDSEYTATDAIILAGSILAQLLLDRKRIETWAVWFIVNVMAIYTYYNAGLVLLSVQYIVFLMNTMYGATTWWKSYKNHLRVRYA